MRFEDEVSDTVNYVGTARVAITGGRGFLGRHVVAELLRRGYNDVHALGSADYDLVRPEAVERMYAELRPTHVVHLAAAVGGIGANLDNPGWFSYANTMMGANVLEGARAHGVQTVLTVGTICVYPADAPVPTPERAIFDGFPAADTAPYGIAKRNLLVMGQAYRRQYGLNAIYLIPTNLYGPHDHFEEHRSHVIPALIRRLLEAKASGAPSVEAWGDGTATRSFLFVEDAALGIAEALERYADPEPVNLGTDVETSMRRLVESIARHTGYSGEIAWDPTKPTGAPRRALDVQRAAEAFGFTAGTPLDEGIRRTVEWYVQQRHEVS